MLDAWRRAGSGKVTSAARYNPFEEKVSINFTEDADNKEVAKAQPVWLTSSTVIKGADQEVKVVFHAGITADNDAS
jgi:hypothetical protein